MVLVVGFMVSTMVSYQQFETWKKTPAADVLLVHLKKDPLFKISIPSKILAYMGVGKPMLKTVDGDAAELVKAGKYRVVAESDNSESIANAAIILFKSNVSVRIAGGRGVRNFYHQHLSLTIGAKIFDKIFRRLSFSSEGVRA